MKGLSKEAATWLEVGEEGAGQRVDNYLTRLLKGVPKSHIYRILRSGEVRVNSGRIGGAQLEACDRLRCRRPQRRAARVAGCATGRAASRLPRLHEDDALSSSTTAGNAAPAAAYRGRYRAVAPQRPQARFPSCASLDREHRGSSSPRSARVTARSRDWRRAAQSSVYLTLVRAFATQHS